MNALKTLDSNERKIRLFFYPVFLVEVKVISFILLFLLLASQVFPFPPEVIYLTHSCILFSLLILGCGVTLVYPSSSFNHLFLGKFTDISSEWKWERERKRDKKKILRKLLLNCQLERMGYATFFFLFVLLVSICTLTDGFFPPLTLFVLHTHCLFFTDNCLFLSFFVFLCVFFFSLLYSFLSLHPCDLTTLTVLV